MVFPIIDTTRERFCGSWLDRSSKVKHGTGMIPSFDTISLSSPLALHGLGGNIGPANTIENHAFRGYGPFLLRWFFGK
jgi:hypothetical protein